jgi:hypothetical protein
MSSGARYSAFDKALHRLAFASPFVQRALAELENDLFGRALAAVQSRREVFIAGLPRAGTTLLLELLYRTGEFATFTYRDMPFIYAPLIWDRVSKTYRRQSELAERAHGDGLEISFDSPEAFEEVVWLAYLKQVLVREKTMAPLRPEQMTNECADALRAAIRKLLVLRRNDDGNAPPRRYLSKNNANLSRIEVLRAAFPTATIAIAFREPAAQVASLMRQHSLFCERHARDPFSRSYMEWIGHYEFGANWRPIDFDGWLEGSALPDRPDADFWMRYWIAAYSYALSAGRERVRFVDFDRLLREGKPELERLAGAIELANPRALLQQSAALRSPTSTPLEPRGVSPAVWSEARRVHGLLQEAAAIE